MTAQANTPAIKWLQAQKLAFDVRPYAYVERGGAAHSAHVLGLDPYAVVKTLVMQDELGHPLVALMHGNVEVSTKALAKAIGCKTVTPCLPEVANKHSGYLVGGTSPFGLRKDMPIYVEASVLALPMVAINAGKRGLLVLVDPACLLRLGAVAVQCAKPKTRG
ncbi:MAG: YbaK/EbsC family protein [Burkholderiaceae bacterium]